MIKSIENTKYISVQSYQGKKINFKQWRFKTGNKSISEKRGEKRKRTKISITEMNGKKQKPKQRKEKEGQKKRPKFCNFYNI